MGEEAHPEGTRSLGDSATCTRSHLQRRRDEQDTPGPGQSYWGSWGRARGASPELVLPRVPTGWQQPPAGPWHPPTERGEGRSPPGAHRAGAARKPGGWKKKSRRPPDSVGLPNGVTRDPPH